MSACSSAPVEPDATPTPSALTLTLWHAQTGVAAQTFNALVADFNKAFPDVIIRAEAKSSDGDLLRQGIAAMAMNQLPDFMLASDRTISEFARRDTLTPLDAYLVDPSLGIPENERADFLPGVIESGRMQNQLVAFPFDLDTGVLIYNIEQLRAARADVPRNWDQFNGASRATTRGTTRGWAMIPDANVFSALILGRGSAILNEARTQAQFGDASGTTTLQMISALSKGGAAYLVDSPDNAMDDFAQGKTVLVLGTTQQLPALANANFQWGITMPPQTDATRPANVVFGSYFALFKTSDAKARVAWQFARWLAQPEQTIRWSRAVYSLPLRISARPALAPDTSNIVLTRWRDSLSDPLPMFRATLTNKDAGTMDAALIEMWTSVVNGADIPSSLTRAVTRINRLLGNTP